ncbi:hypothetical protein MXG19_005044 [Salmonella enterica]|nr:hypothetical protein [Salmonella enterica]EHK4302261.1 hypothetical protein [Salmonella enterica]EHK4316715.1 hypothetical protein [Salmonella enterica]EHK4321622.1 hypothetical protein [Salmonella enterica]EJB8843096.1 hypothetical protein [Salmonella enterica]
MHKNLSVCRAQVTGEQPTQRGQEGNPARIWQNRSMSAFLCDELIRAGVIRSLRRAPVCVALRRYF